MMKTQRENRLHSKLEYFRAAIGMSKFSALKLFCLRFAIGRGMSSEHGEFIGNLGVLEMQVLELSIDSTFHFDR